MMAKNIGEFSDRLEILFKTYQTLLSTQFLKGITREMLECFQPLVLGLHAAVGLLDGQTGVVTIAVPVNTTFNGGTFSLRPEHCKNRKVFRTTF
jgi:hypothetical protein